MTWNVLESTGPASTFHARPFDDPVVPTVHVLHVDRPALVLGSTQRDDVVDGAAAARAGVEVVRRRSGGGAVLLDPGEVVWFDVDLPRGHGLWDDDVTRAPVWLGERGGAAIHALGVAAPAVHRGGLVRRPWSDLVCFAGLGPGEVTAGAGGPKVLGVSQRRTRAGARFQCAIPLTWAYARIVGLLALDDDARAAARAALAGAVAPVERPAAEVAAAVVDALTTPA